MMNYLACYQDPRERFFEPMDVDEPEVNETEYFSTDPTEDYLTWRERFFEPMDVDEGEIVYGPVVEEEHFLGVNQGNQYNGIVPQQTPNFTQIKNHSIWSPEPPYWSFSPELLAAIRKWNPLFGLGNSDRIFEANTSRDKFVSANSTDNCEPQLLGECNSGDNANLEAPRFFEPMDVDEGEIIYCPVEEEEHFIVVDKNIECKKTVPQQNSNCIAMAEQLTRSPEPPHPASFPPEILAAIKMWNPILGPGNIDRMFAPEMAGDKSVSAKVSDDYEDDRGPQLQRECNSSDNNSKTTDQQLNPQDGVEKSINDQIIIRNQDEQNGCKAPEEKRNGGKGNSDDGHEDYNLTIRRNTDHNIGRASAAEFGHKANKERGKNQTTRCNPFDNGGCGVAAEERYEEKDDDDDYQDDDDIYDGSTDEGKRRRS